MTPLQSLFTSQTREQGSVCSGGRCEASHAARAEGEWREGKGLQRRGSIMTLRGLS